MFDDGAVTEQLNPDAMAKSKCKNNTEGKEERELDSDSHGMLGSLWVASSQFIGNPRAVSRFKILASQYVNLECNYFRKTQIKTRRGN